MDLRPCHVAQPVDAINAEYMAHDELLSGLRGKIITAIFVFQAIKVMQIKTMLYLHNCIFIPRST